MAQFGAPNFLGVISAYEAGADRAERSRLRDLAEQGRVLQGKALGGDQNALAQLGQVNPQAYMQTASFTADQKKQRFGEFMSAAYSAKTPEQWKSVVDRFKAQGHQFGPGEDAFENRENLIRQGMSVADQMGFDWKQQDAQRDQANNDRSFGLQQQGFQADQSYRQQQIALEKQKLAATQSSAMKPDLKDITTIRKEIGDLPSYKTYSAALPVYNSMAKAADTKAGDLNLVYGLAKIFDPTSVVREGEQVLVRDTASLPDWLVGQINSLNGGNRLLADTRKSLMAEARNRVDAYKGAYESNLQPYRGIAGRYQINEADIIPQMGALEEAPANGAGDPLGLR